MRKETKTRYIYDDIHRARCTSESYAQVVTSSSANTTVSNTILLDLCRRSGGALRSVQGWKLEREREKVALQLLHTQWQFSILCAQRSCVSSQPSRCSVFVSGHGSRTKKENTLLNHDYTTKTWDDRWAAAKGYRRNHNVRNLRTYSYIHTYSYPLPGQGEGY